MQYYVDTADREYSLGFLAVPETPYLMSKSIHVSTSVSELVLDEDSGCHAIEQERFEFQVEGNAIGPKKQRNGKNKRSMED